MRKVIFCAVVWRALASVAHVAVVQGNESVAEGERRFAQSLANHVVRWYTDAGVDCEQTDDTGMKTALAHARVAVLVYVAQPSASQMQELKAFVERDGKLIVCYSSSPALAELMGMQVGGYQKGSTDGRWSQMRFVKGAPRGVPGTVLQSSSNLFVVRPVEGRSQVIAWWHDRQGKQTAEPAWLMSPQGYWMTHVLSGDGDAKAKGQLLLALAAAQEPGLWQVAAGKRLHELTQKNVRYTPPRLKAQAEALKHSKQRRLAVTSAETAQEVWTSAERLFAEGKGYEAWMAADELRARMLETYGMTQCPRKGEIRAVWDHSGMGLYPGDWARTCQLLKHAGITDLYVNVAGAGFAHYASAVLPRSRVCEEQGDQLAACVAAAKPLGLRVHAWLLCFSTEGATQERISVFAKRGWLLTNADGTPRPWLDPAAPAVRAYLVDAAQEMATNYQVDGIHLDFVRYPDFMSSLGPTVRAHFEAAAKMKVADWPKDVKDNGRHSAAFTSWRSEQVTDFVQAVRKVMKRDAPGKLLTAAVFGKHPSCVDAVGQDWVSWLDMGMLDYVAPMNYTEDMAKFNEWLGDQTRTRKQAMKIVAGIGVTAAESRLDSAQVIDQINAARKAGCPGFALFSLDTTLRQEILPVLRLGVTAPAQ